MTSKPVQAAIPAGLAFASLKLSRDPVTGDVAFDWAPIEAICEASGLDVELFRSGPEDNVGALIVAWYNAHRQDGGAPDPVAEELIGEARLEDQFGSGYSHQPGRA